MPHDVHYDMRFFQEINVLLIWSMESLPGCQPLQGMFFDLLKVLGGKKRFPKWPNGGEQLWVPMVFNKHHCLKMNFSFCPKWDMLVPWRVTWHPDLCNVQKHYPKETLGAKIQTGSSCELQAHWMIPFVQSQKSRDFPLFKGKNIHSRRGWKLSYHQHQSYHTQ